MVRSAAEGLRSRGLRVRGFYTEEVRDERGRREGFRAVTFGGRRRTMASVQIDGPPRVGKYGVDLETVDGLGAELEAGEEEDRPDLYLLDEIGKMECASDRFVRAVRRLLESPPCPLVATVARRGGGLIREVKQHPRTELWEVTRSNRDDLPGRLVAWVLSRL